MSHSTYLEKYSYTSLTERRIFEGGLSLYGSTHGGSQQIGYRTKKNTFTNSLFQQDLPKSLPFDVGALSKLLVMPVDIFCEIATHLEPLDILNLARSTRDLNNFLMSKVSQPVWRTARSYYPGLPECPPDLSEPEYARLLFETDTCHACLKPRETRAYFAARARLCDICSTTTILKFVELVRLFPDLTGCEELLKCLPCHTHTVPRYRDLRDEGFYAPRVESLLRKYQQFYLKSPSCSSMYSELRYLRYGRGIADFNKVYPPISLDAVVKHAAKMDQWCVTYKQIKAMEIAASVERHQSIIKNKLTDLGHNPRDFPGDWDTEWEDIMSNPQTYSSDRWKSVLRILEDCIHRERDRREAEERETRQVTREKEILSHLSTLTSKPSWINIAEFLLLPTVKAMYSQNDYCRVITKELWDTKLPEIQNDIESYQHDILNFLIDKIKSTSYITIRDDCAKILEAPTTFFKCSCCSESLLRYPALLSHNKYSPTKRILEKYVEFNISASNVAQNLLVRIGSKNHQHNSYVEMQFKCLRCRASKPMSWTELVRHYMQEQHKASCKKHILRLGPIHDHSGEADHSFNDTLSAMTLSLEDLSEPKSLGGLQEDSVTTQVATD